MQHKNTKQAKTNYQNKNKLTLNNKGNNSLCTRTLWEEGNRLFCVFSLYYYFQTQISMLQTVRAGKVVGKNGVICLVSMLSSWVVVLKLSGRVYFLQFCAELSKNPNLLKQFTYFHLKVIESRHLEVTKSLYYLLCPKWSQEKVSAHGLIWEIKIPRKFWNISIPKIRKTTREIY